MSVHSLHVSVSDFRLLKWPMGYTDTHVYFSRSMATTPRSESTELQKWYKNSAAGLSQKNS